MLTIVLFINFMQLVAAQQILNPQVLNGAVGTCPPQYMRDLARRNLSQSVYDIIADNVTIIHQCGVG